MHDDGVVVGKSRLEGAGLGLFAARALPRGHLLAWMVRPAESDTDDAARRHDLGLWVDTTTFVYDATPCDCTWYMMNHGKLHANVAPVRLDRRTLKPTRARTGLTIGFRTLRDVVEGEELFWDYGEPDPDWAPN